VSAGQVEPVCFTVGETDAGEAKMTATSQQPISRKPRRGTNVRLRQAQVSVRLTADEYAAVKATADQRQRSPAAVLRDAFFAPSR
jgi:hypothetical protein